MKIENMIAALVLVSATALAGPMVVYPDGHKIWTWPQTIGHPDGRTTISPTVEMCIEAGAARWETPAEQSAREAAEAEQAAAQEAHDALYADPQPAVMVPRISGTLTNVVGESQILVDAETGEVFALDETGSPEHTISQKQAQNAEREVRKAAARKAKAHGNLQARIDALEALAGIE